MERRLNVLLLTQDARGWGPIQQLAELASTLAGTELRMLPMSPHHSRSRLLISAALSASQFPFTRGLSADLLVIAPVPGALNEIVNHPELRAQHRNVFAWVIDSFWTERIPSTLKIPGVFHHVYITDSDDLAEWQRKTAAPVSVLPWGTDALNAYRQRRDKDIDVLRVGRQPAAWEDDRRSAQDCADQGLVFHGRPKLSGSEQENNAALHQSYSRARVVLASGTRAAPAPYTHPTKEYVTGRWTDAFAHGCLVAGEPPRCGSAAQLLPPQFLIPIDTGNRPAGIAAIKTVLEHPTKPDTIRTFALRSLDWRHRLAEVFARAGVSTTRLEAELETINAAATEMESGDQS